MPEEVPVPPWREWVQLHFRFVTYFPFARRHIRLWDWFAGLERGTAPDPIGEIWGRGGAKSSTVELACTYVGVTRQRRFVLYVSATQELADKHVSSIAAWFEKLGVERALNTYGHSKGWKRNQLRTATGFNVVALGLDSASRGVKLEEFRPDLIIFDDVDERDDTPKTIKKKIAAMTTSILPAGSTDLAVCFIQNLIHEESIASKIASGKADFLATMKKPAIEPAVSNLQVELRYDEDRQKNVYVVVGGEPTWEGQNLTVVQQQINLWGLSAFLREAQHEVSQTDGFFFNDKNFGRCSPAEVPRLLRLCRAWDLAGTEGGGDYSASVLGGIAVNGRIFVLHKWREQRSSDNVRKEIIRHVIQDRKNYPHVKLTYHFPQDPGQAGKDQAAQLLKLIRGEDDSVTVCKFLVSLGLGLTPEIAERTRALASGQYATQDVERLKSELDEDREKAAIQEFRGIVSGIEIKIEPVSGSKAVRARGYADSVNSGNVILVEGMGDIFEFTEEHRKFREDESHAFDDLVDAGADMFNEVISRAPVETTGAKRPPPEKRQSNGVFL